MSRIRRGTNSLFLLAVSAALAFGATQAAAAPGAAAEGAPACKWYFGSTCAAGVAGLCADYCRNLGFAGSTCGDDPARPRSCCECHN